MKILEEEEILAYMAFPREHWAQIHSTNPLERLNREIIMIPKIKTDKTAQIS